MFYTQHTEYKLFIPMVDFFNLLKVSFLQIFYAILGVVKMEV